ncbi:MAG: hypothetical protein K9G64_02510 [Bacteroidia bacterium]|nr:hypothetical protein [Bacteroidia bacterium]
MGLVRELFDEVIPLPNAMQSKIIGKNEMIAVYNLSYAFLNAVFQVIDCIIIPYFTWIILLKLNSNFNLFLALLFGVTFLSSLFSLIQVIYYFIKPADKYINFSDRIIGETSIGALLSALFKIPINTYIKSNGKK